MLPSPPGPKGWPFLGNAPEYLRDPLAFVTRCAREYGDVVSIRLPGLPAVLLCNPEHIEQVLRGNHREFIKDKLTRSLSGFLGDGLLTSEGDFWRRQRQLIQPAFQSQQVQRYTAVMVADAGRLVDGWSEGQPIDICREMSRLTARIVAKTLFDAQVDDVADDVARALDAVMAHFANPAVSFSRLPAWFPTPSRLRYRAAVRRIDAIISRIISQRQTGRHDPGDLLGRLLEARDEAGGSMTGKQLRDELVTLFLAGHETTALSLAYCFYLLASHPEAEARWHAELDTVLGGSPPTAADVQRLTYTDWIVRESMRLYPPAWTIAREAIAECQIGGFHIPRGAQLWPVQWIVHRDPRWFNRPDEFLPERWEGDLARRLPRCAYFPFGDGPRICIGQSFAMLEAVLILATVGQRMRLTLWPGFRLQLAPSITLRPKHGIAMTAHARQRTLAAAGTPA